ncbi:flavin reductase family protein [Rhodococcus sp. LB1]|uniref:flavin reductase family protein n=1 Tax=Rhodococcus sp. LB1 TaxID=1807499 RepID=UPI003FA71D41
MVKVARDLCLCRQLRSSVFFMRMRIPENQFIDAVKFRDVLGHLPTGVSVVTANGPDGPIGMACNSITSVSLTPPLVAFCPAKSSTTWPEIRATRRFCINVMAGHHESAVRAFAARGIDRFGGIPTIDGDCGPVFEDAVAQIDCELSAEHVAGDHFIAVGSVLTLKARSERDALIFFRGEFSAIGR